MLIHGDKPAAQVNALHFSLTRALSVTWIGYSESAIKRAVRTFSTRNENLLTGSRSAVGNVSGYRCVSDCRSRGREFDPDPVPYFRGG